MATQKGTNDDGDKGDGDKTNEKDEVLEENKAMWWDRFKETEEDRLPPDDHDFWDKVYFVTKVLFSGFLFVCVLGSSVVSKGVLLILTWNIFTPVSKNASNLKTLDNIFHYNVNVTSPADNDSVTSIYYIWALFVMVVAPNVFTVLFCVWRIIFKKTGTLQWVPLLVALISASLHTVGLNFIVFYILPSLDPISGLWYCCCVTFVPSIVKFAFGEKTLRRKQNIENGKKSENSSTFAWTFFVRILAVLLSALSLAFWGIYIALSSSSSAKIAQIVLSILSPILVSLSWLENFLPSEKSEDNEQRTTKINVTEAAFTDNGNGGKADSELQEESEDRKQRTETTDDIEASMPDNSNSGKADSEIDHEPQITYPNIIYEYKNTIFQSRFKTSAIVHSWKVILTFFMVIAIHGSPCDDCVRVLLGRLKHPVNQNFGIIKEVWLMSDDFCNTATPFIIAIIGISTSIFCQRLSVAAIKVVAQLQGFSVPLCLVSPVTFLLIIIISSQLNDSSHICRFPFPWFDGNTSVNNVAYLIIASLTGYLSLLLTAGHIWNKETDRMSKENKIFYQPTYCSILFEQSLMLNKCKEVKTIPVKKSNEGSKQSVQKPSSKDAHPPDINQIQPKDKHTAVNGDIPMIYFCATMWHETEVEMTQLLKSLFRMDIDQCVQSCRKSVTDKYNLAVHIFFDDAFLEGGLIANQYVQTFIKTLYETSRDTYPKEIPQLKSPRRRITPYGGRLVWTLPSENKLYVHLKDKYKIRRKKRWSQVMYMYYFLSHKLGSAKLDEENQIERAKNIFILALDGDVDFRPEAVKLLIDRMKRNEQTGAACGRIHPIGDGPMVWYQKFEYAISHWLVKATEHVTGCVLCSPGCFSLFRGSSLMENNVMRRYTTMPTQARHHLQYDQGEDRWLCTLLLKQGKKVDYCAGSDAFTFAPGGFKEFYNQRRRWTPSTMANILDILMDWRVVTNNNDNVSIPYICLQLSWFMSSVLTPGVLFLMIVGATNLAYPSLSLHAALLINLLPVIVFVLVCFFAKTDHQLNVAAALSILYSLVMMIVLVGLIRETVEDGFCSVITWFLLIVSGIFVLAGLTHPKETKCLVHGFLFFIAIPSMSMLLMLYSIINLNNVSWGTREAPKTPKQGEGSGDNNKVSSVKGFLDKILSCSCCQPQILYKNSKVDVKLEQSKTELDNIESGTEQREEMQSEETDTTKGKLQQTKKAPVPYSKYLNFDPESSSKIKLIALPEEQFWKWLIKTYLYPVDKSNGDTEEEAKRFKEQAKVKKELKTLRNKASLAYLLINALFVTVIYFLQQSNVNTDGGLSIHIECGAGDELVLEPISLAFTAVAGILLAIQFLCMLIHRAKTFLQINSITELKRETDVNTLFNDIARDIINKKQIVKEDDKSKGDSKDRSIKEEKPEPKLRLRPFIEKNVMTQLENVTEQWQSKDSKTDGGASAAIQKSRTGKNKDPKTKFSSTVPVLRGANRTKLHNLLRSNRLEDLTESLILSTRSGAEQLRKMSEKPANAPDGSSLHGGRDRIKRILKEYKPSKNDGESSKEDTTT